MNVIDHMAMAGGYNPGQGYNAGNVLPTGTVAIDADIIRTSMQWLKTFDDMGARGGTEHMLRMFFDEHMQSGASGATGPVLSREQFSNAALIPLLVTYTGLMMNTRQRGSLQALTNLLSVLHTPEKIPIKKVQFILRFKNCGQVLAQKGQMTTKVGGVSTSYNDITITMERYVAGFSIGDQELFLESDPAEVITALAEKMQSLETTWGLTMVHLHAVYVSRQPSLTQRMLMSNVLHQPDNNFMGKILQICFAEHLMCGALNRSQYNLQRVLTSLSEIIKSDTGEIIAVVPQLITDCGKLALDKVRIVSNKQRYTYNPNRPNGMEGYALFGRVNSDPNNDTYTISNSRRMLQIVGTRRPDDNLTDVAPDKVGDTVEVDMIKLENGHHCFVATIDSTPFDLSPNADSCDAPLKQAGVKRVFFTVGACPDAYQHYCNSGFFGAANSPSGSISPKTVCEANPGVTYYMDYDTNRVAKVTLESIHQMVAHEELFDATLAWEMWTQVFNADQLGFVNEEESAELLRMTAKQRRQSPLLMFETNPRMMFAVSTANKHHAVKYQLGETNSFVYYVPRMVLGNASACSDFNNEMVGCIGSLAHLVQDSVHHLTNLVAYISKNLSNVRPAQVRAMRRIAVDTMVSADIVDALKILVAEAALTDPICQVKYLSVYAKAMNLASQPVDLDVLDATRDAAIANNTAVAADPNASQGDKDIATAARDGAMQASLEGREQIVLTEYVRDNNGVLTKLYDMIVGAHKDIDCLVDTVYAFEDYNAILAAATPLIYDPAHNLPADSRYLKFMYGIAMPAVSVNIDRPSLSTLVPDNKNDQLLPLTLDSMDDGVFVTHASALHPYHSASITAYRPLFRTRHEMLMKRFSNCTMVRVLALMHYWTFWNATTMENHFDKLYYSGLSYLVVRHMKFKGYNVAAMPPKSSRMLVGNRAAAFPTTTWLNTEFKQTMDMAMAPMDMTSIGVVCNNVYITDVKGMSDQFDPHNPDCNLIFDSYNDYLPEGIDNYQGGGGLLSVHGRFDNVGNVTTDMDPISGHYTELPTSFFKTSVLFNRTKTVLLNNVYTEDSSVGMMEAALNVNSFTESVPGHIVAAIERGLTQANIVTQVITGSQKAQTIFTRQFGAMSTDDYAVGFGSSTLLRGGPSSHLHPELQPRISSIGGLSPNAAFGQTDNDPKFMSAFMKQIAIARASMARSF